jgi:hypothetical protein
MALFGSIAGATTAEEIMDKAREAREVDSSVQQVTMVLVSKSGSERSRDLEIKVKKDGEIIKSHIRFASPADVAGTTFLQIDNPDQVDEQLLYLPALKRVNRISGKSRKGAFMGSDFSYEDMELSEAPDADHAVVEETDAVWVIDTNPGADSTYGRIRSHVTKADYMARKVEFFDKDNEALKVLEVLATELDGTITVATKSIMTSLSRGTKTRLEVKEHRLNVPAEELPDELFTQAALERGG